MALTAVEAESDDTLMDGSKRIFAPSRKSAPRTVPSVFIAGAWVPTRLLFMLEGTITLSAWLRQVAQSSSRGRMSPARPVILEAVWPGVPLPFNDPRARPPTLVLVGCPEEFT